MKWLAIALFALGPWLTWLLVLATCPDPAPSSDFAVKARLFLRRPHTDTVLIGDSRVMNIAPEPFTARGFAFFNLSAIGSSASDAGIQLELALRYGRIRRVLMGASFEAMTEFTPYETSQHAHDAVVQPLLPFRFLPAQPPPDRRVPDRFQDASARLHALFADPDPGFAEDGTATYIRVYDRMQSGEYERVREMDPLPFFNRPDYERAYLRTRHLSPYAQSVYRAMFAELRRRHIPCLVFETGRTAAFQHLLDRDPFLTALQAEWRAFYHGESHDGLRFVPLTTLAPAYDERDFIDPVHFIGRTGTRLATRLAALLAELEP